MICYKESNSYPYHTKPKNQKVTFPLPLIGRQILQAIVHASLTQNVY